MSNTDPESTLEQRIARLEELALAQTQGMMLSHHLMEMEQHKESLQRQAQQLPDQPLIAADLTELSQKMQFTERQWERAKALSQQLTQESGFPATGRHTSNCTGGRIPAKARRHLLG